MGKKSEISLGEAIKEVLKRLRMDEKLEEISLIDSWEKVVGPMISRHTDNLVVRNKILYVNLDSAPLRSELMLARSKIVKTLNKEAGKKVIEDIVFR